MNKRSRILILSQFYPPEYVTAAVLIGQMAEDVAAEGLDVEVLCGWPKEYMAEHGRVPAHETNNGVRIRRLKYVQLPRESRLGRLVNYFTFVLSVVLRWPTLLGYGLIVVYTNPPLLPAIPAALNRLFGQKFVFVCYDLYPELAIRMGAVAKGSAIDRVMGPINRAVYGHAEAVVALGQDMKRYMTESGLARDASRVEIIPTGMTMAPTATARFRLKGRRPSPSSTAATWASARIWRRYWTPFGGCATGPCWASRRAWWPSWRSACWPPPACRS